jgi:hypothetical protein
VNKKPLIVIAVAQFTPQTTGTSSLSQEKLEVCAEWHKIAVKPH